MDERDGRVVCKAEEEVEVLAHRFANRKAGLHLIQAPGAHRQAARGEQAALHPARAQVVDPFHLQGGCRKFPGLDALGRAVHPHVRGGDHVGIGACRMRFCNMGQELGMKPIVRIEKGNPVALRERDATVACCGDACVVLAHEAQARIADGFDNLRSAVGGTIVDNDHFQGRQLLRERRADGAFDERCLVVEGDDYRDAQAPPPFEPERKLLIRIRDRVASNHECFPRGNWYC